MTFEGRPPALRVSAFTVMAGDVVSAMTGRLGTTWLVKSGWASAASPV
jgi:hypothetical protein